VVSREKKNKKNGEKGGGKKGRKTIFSKMDRVQESLTSEYLAAQ